MKNRLLNKDINSGVKSSYFPWYNRTFKGFRKGEFSIFTGPTGSGKTTFLSQLSLDFSISGVPTLWCSFEIKNEVLLSTMVSQYAGIDLAKEPNRFDFVADRFENIPMYFQTYFGSTHVDDVITMIDYAIYTHDVGHVVIDNLQFMLSGQGRGIDRFEMQDEVVAKLRKMATSHNVHITLVIHPRKGEDGADLTLSSIFGTAKSTQEADNVMILQQRDKYRVIDIKKNRYDGEIGRTCLWFDKQSKRFEQISAKEIEELLTGAKLSDIIERKGREVNLEAIAYQSEEVVVEELPVPKLTHKPESIVMDENLKRMLARRNGHQGSKDFHKAFSRLDEFKSAVMRGTEQEPSYQDSAITHTFAPEYEVKSSIEVRVGTKPKIEATAPLEDSPFEIKFEGKYEEIGVSVPINQLSSGDLKAKSQEAATTTTLNKEELDDDVFEPKFVSSLLDGLGSGEQVQTLQTMYKEETLYTYNDLIEELSGPANKKKYPSKYSSQNASNIEYKGPSKKSPSEKNKK